MEPWKSVRYAIIMKYLASHIRAILIALPNGLKSLQPQPFKNVKIILVSLSFGT